MDNAFTARNVAKWMSTSIIAMQTADLAADTTANHTHFERDDLVVRLGAGCVGWFVSSKLEPVTDKIVDTAADYIVELRAKRTAKKDAKKQEK